MVSQSNWRSLSASCAHTCAAMWVCCNRIAHWKYCRLCKPERKMKWPSSNAPVLRKSASRSPLIVVGRRFCPALAAAKIAAPQSCRRWSSSGRITDGLSAHSTLVGHGDGFDFHTRAFGQSGDLHGRASGRRLLEIRTVNFIHGLKIGEIGEKNCCLDDAFE